MSLRPCWVGPQLGFFPVSSEPVKEFNWRVNGSFVLWSKVEKVHVCVLECSPQRLWGGALPLGAGARVEVSALLPPSRSVPGAQAPGIAPPGAPPPHRKFWAEGPASSALQAAPHEQVKIAQARRERGSKGVRVYYPDSVLISWELSWALLMTLWKQTNKQGEINRSLQKKKKKS